MCVQAGSSCSMLRCCDIIPAAPAPCPADVPWESSSQSFTGKIVHHEETARLQALKQAVDSAVKQIESSIDEAPEDE